MGARRDGQSDDGPRAGVRRTARHAAGPNCPDVEPQRLRTRGDGGDSFVKLKRCGLGATATCGGAVAASAATSTDPRGNVGHFFLALDPGLFRAPDAFAAEVGNMLDLLRATPSVHPDIPVQVAGDPEYRAFDDRSRAGLPLPTSLIDALRDVGERAGARWELGGTFAEGTGE